MNRGVDDLPQVVGRNVGGHPYGNPGTAVDDQIRCGGRQTLRLLRGVVKVRPEVDRFLFDLLQQGFRKGGESRFGVPHGCRRVAVHRAEVALPVHQHVSHREGLRHANQGFIARRIPMGVVVSHHLADDFGRLPVAAVRAQAEVEHSVEDAPLYGLEAVTNVGQRPSDDHAHRIVEIGLLHLDFDVDGRPIRRGSVAA